MFLGTWVNMGYPWVEKADFHMGWVGFKFEKLTHSKTLVVMFGLMAVIGLARL